VFSACVAAVNSRPLLHAVLLMNSFSKTEAGVFSYRLCFLVAFPFISLIYVFYCVLNFNIFVPDSVLFFMYAHVILLNENIFFDGVYFKENQNLLIISINTRSRYIKNSGLQCEGYKILFEDLVFYKN